MSIPLVDSHHHVWDAADLPWLTGEPVPRIFGPYDAIRRDYSVEEYVAEAEPHGVQAAVYVQANWPLDRSLDEIRWLEETYERTGWPVAFIGSADLYDPTARQVMAQQAKISERVRGTRLQLHWHDRPDFRFAAGPEQMKDPVFRDNIAALADLGWLFELQVFAPQMRDAAAFVSDYPDTTFVLVHAGMLEGQEPRQVEAWTDGMRLLSECPNVVTKLTGQGTFIHRVDDDLIRLVAHTCLELFGAARCMWGSNFPIEKIWTDFGTLTRAWRTALAGFPVETQEAVFHANARRVYGL